MPSDFEILKEIFERDVCQRATKPLKKGAQIAITLSDKSQVSLRKTDSGIKAEASPAEKPDMSFEIPTGALQHLQKVDSEDIGDIGVEILKLMASAEPKKKVRAKVHIGAFSLFTQGYLGILPLGGPAVMKFLGTKGLTNIGKIKEALSKLKG